MAEIATRDPPQLLSKERLWLARDRRVAKVQTYGALRIGVLGDEDLVADRRVHTQFLGEFTCQAHLVGLAWLAFPAWKLPIAGQVRAFESTGDEQALATFDDRGDDDHGG